jgi:hypothetical protein
MSVFLTGGQANVFYSPQIDNPQILGLIPLLKIRRFLKCASALIANRKYFTNNLEIAHFLGVLFR